MDTIKDNLERVRERITRAAEKSGRNVDDIKLVAVTKTVPVDRIREAIIAGINIIGENRVQEAQAKKRAIELPARWHLVGHLQTNKAKKACRIFNFIHSLDRLSLAEELEKQLAKIDKWMDALVQVNVSREETKHGFFAEDAIDFMEKAPSFPHLRIRGLMTIAPFVSDPEENRPVFHSLSDLGEKIKEAKLKGVEIEYLSMGMTQDFEIAIEEGANMVRIGTGIFGARH